MPDQENQVYVCGLYDAALLDETLPIAEWQSAYIGTHVATTTPEVGDSICNHLDGAYEEAPSGKPISGVVVCARKYPIDRAGDYAVVLVLDEDVRPGNLVLRMVADGVSRFSPRSPDSANLMKFQKVADRLYEEYSRGTIGEIIRHSSSREGADMIDLVLIKKGLTVSGKSAIREVPHWIRGRANRQVGDTVASHGFSAGQAGRVAALSCEEFSKQKFDVGISVAGPDRVHARELAAALKERGVSVFYDEDYMAELWGSDLAVTLQQVYGQQCSYVVMFCSAAYLASAWTQHEVRSALEPLVEKKGEAFILPIKLDDSPLPSGLPGTLNYLGIEHGVGSLADLIRTKLGA